ncbi:uncharacterized protein L201_004770 [Kwoniella dendrophila CBS 6074]|uniref:Nucleoporin NSP1-like C-terminal domain-containing protein n=1 Tax=Kwoniella dendrophila CBS 6074 TaxID=1295534 RepID=A0AAX4JWV3_9TREE
MNSNIENYLRSMSHNEGEAEKFSYDNLSAVHDQCVFDRDFKALSRACKEYYELHQELWNSCIDESKSETNFEQTWNTLKTYEERLEFSERLTRKTENKYHSKIKDNLNEGISFAENIARTIYQSTKWPYPVPEFPNSDYRLAESLSNFIDNENPPTEQYLLHDLPIEYSRLTESIKSLKSWKDGDDMSVDEMRSEIAKLAENLNALKGKLVFGNAVRGCISGSVKSLQSAYQ